jgi:N-acetylmuramoyl-L-alanine amidase
MKNKKNYIRTIIIIALVALIALPWYNIIMLKAKEVVKLNVENSKDDFIVCIDPGHQSRGDSKGEPIAPGAYNTKPRVSAGTKGIGTKRPEYMVNLEASLILKKLLEDKGYKVIMTREDNDVNLSNIERAEIANNSKANLAIRIHCDSLNDSNKRGATILIPAKNSKYTTEIYEESRRYGEILRDHLKSSNIKTNGIIERKDITGFNWSKVPVIILEMGFMSNWEEDRMLSDVNYQNKLMECVANAIEEYRNLNEN